MSQADRIEIENLPDLDAEEQAWLDERIAEYSELLTYLREH